MRSYYSGVGGKPTDLLNYSTRLSLNDSSSNRDLISGMIADSHKYLLERYFFNESSTAVQTVGSQSLVLTGALAIGATSATLTAAWLYHTTEAQITFSSGELRACRVSKGLTAITWDAPLTIVTTTAISVGGLQYYPLPYNFSQLKDITITQGTLKWTPKEVFTREDWDRLNPFPYYSDIPNNFFIWNGQMGIWPIPASGANTLTFNYKIRVPDLTFADYVTGTVTMTNGSSTVAGAGATTWMANYLPSAGSVMNLNLWLKATAPNGDNNWYRISSIESDTSLTLVNTYAGSTKAACSYTIGQMPLLLEDYHDLLVYRPLMLYFSTIVDNPNKKKEFTDFYNEGIAKLDSYSGKKTIQVNLRQQINSINPNIYQNNIGNTP
jgi:hypothetical protein